MNTRLILGSLLLASAALYITGDVFEAHPTRAIAAGVVKNEGECFEVTLSDSISDEASLLYSGEVWGDRGKPPIYTCPLEMIQAVRAGAEALYFTGAIFISSEAGLINDDQYAWSLVVHELTHHLQSLDGKLAMIDRGELRVCQAENEAYRAQRAYLELRKSAWDIEWAGDECATELAAASL